MKYLEAIRHEPVKIPPWLQLGQRVRINYVPGAVTNVVVGETGVVVDTPRVILGKVDVKLLLDDGRKLVWKLENMEPIQEEEETKETEPTEAIAEAVSVEVVLMEELTPAEESERLQLERQVERAFYNAGKALQQLRDRRLYRSTHKTFEEYCRDRFGFTRRHINYLIAGSLVVDNLKMGTNGSQIETEDEMGTNGSQILPTSERQVRPLTKLEPEEQLEAWQEAVEEAGGQVPSSRIVKDVVQRIRERTPVPNPRAVSFSTK